jgi:hypothetical protein
MKMTEQQRQVLRDVAEVVAGLQVPVSLGVRLGTAREPWGRLFNLLRDAGWSDADKIEQRLLEVFGG